MSVWGGLKQIRWSSYTCYKNKVHVWEWSGGVVDYLIDTSINLMQFTFEMRFRNYYIRINEVYSM